MVPDGKECASTMLGRVGPRSDTDMKNHLVVQAALHALAAEVTAVPYLLNEPGLAVVKWNDTPGRTLAEVHAAFDAAITKLEKEAIAQ
jgi:hypothetical protein